MRFNIQLLLSILIFLFLGAFSLAQALASHTSKSAKEKLAEVRTEQKELLEVRLFSIS